MPGMKPARNTLMMETSAATAYTTMMMEGGSRMPSVPAAASEPRHVFSSYPLFLSSGSATLAIVAQVAAEEPDTVPNTAQPRMLTCIRRPGSQPSHGERPSNISSESRVRYRISPIHTKSGSAASVHEALEPQNDWNRLTSGGVLVKNCSPNHATAASEMAIQTPPVRSTSSSTSSTIADSNGVTAAASQLLRKVARGGARFLRALIGRFFPAQHGEELIEHGDEKDGDAERQRELRNPDGHADQALRYFLELPAVVDEARDRPQDVGDEERRHHECEELGVPARALGEAIEEYADTHEVAAAEGVTKRQKGARRAEPRHNVIRAADQDAGFAPRGLREHQHADRRHGKRGGDAGRVVEAVEKPPHPSE